MTDDKGGQVPSELSAGGMKRDVENTPKCSRLNCILARRSSLGPPPVGWHRILKPSNLFYQRIFRAVKVPQTVLKFLDKIAKFSQNWPKFFFLYAKRYTGLKKVDTQPMVLTNMSYVIRTGRPAK